LIKKLLYYYKNSKFLKDNIILSIGALISGILGFAFHFYMGRTLGPANYSVLGVILSISYIMNIGLNALQTSATKFVSEFNVKKEYSKISYLINQSIKKLTIYGIILLVIFILITPLLSKFLHIKITPLLLISLCIIFLLLLPINRGSLQGLQRFKGLSLNLIIEGTVKLFGGILLVFLGLGVNGAIISIVLSYVISFFAGFYPIGDIIRRKKKKFNTKEIYKFSIPVLITLISLTLIFSMDIILVKHFFNEIEAGYYVASSILAKIIFFATLSISQVMFPKVSELHNQNKKHKHLLIKSLLIGLIIIIPTIIIYYLFPKLIISILFGKEFLPITRYIGPFAIIIGLYSLIYMMAFYKLSINKKKFIYILILFNVIQVILIILFHSSIMQVINVLIIYMLILFTIMFSLTIQNSKYG